MLNARLKDIVGVTAIKKQKRARKTRDELITLTPFVRQLLARGDVAQMSNPAQLSELAFGLYRRRKEDFVSIKDTPADQRLTKRFKLFLSEISAGRSPLSAADGAEILGASSYFMGLSQEIDDSGLDVGSHFRMSSSFSEKGRILYNAVKYFDREQCSKSARPMACPRDLCSRQANAIARIAFCIRSKPVSRSSHWPPIL